MKLVGIDIAKYKHAAFIMDASTGNLYVILFYSKTIKMDFKNFMTNLINTHKMNF